MNIIFIILLFFIFFMTEKYNLNIIENTHKYYRYLVFFILIISLVYKPDLIYDFIHLFYDTNRSIYIPKKFKIDKIINQNLIKQKRNVSNTVKKLVASNQQWKCSKCGQLLDATYEVDHTIPLYKGGTNHINNLTAMCRNCHGRKTLEDKLFY